ncbi:MAG TPA: DUF58 domain-containing protein [Acidimicrobiales bacterium]|nr:DUF58 domain-containing protein [Acidimicrobiales bacterium]
MRDRSEGDPGPPVPVTATGFAVGVVGVLTVVLGLVLGLAEVTGLGIATILLVLVATVSVRLQHPSLGCNRTLGATRTVVDHTVTVQSTVTHTGAGHSRQVRLVHPVTYPDGRTSTARHTVPPLAAGETDTSSFGLRIPRRGIAVVGKVRIELTDPFGLARRALPGPAATRITVLPRIAQILPPQFRIEAESHVTAPPSDSLGTEFASLREYTRGDDLRKVHWRTSARRDELVVRRDAEPMRPGCTVVLDVRAGVHDTTSFESAVSAAASILVGAGRASQPTRLCTTAGFDSARGSGHHHVDLVLGMLAVVEQSRDDVDVPVRGPDPVIVLTTPNGSATLRAAMGAAVAGALTVLFEPSDGPTHRSDPDGPMVVRVGAEDDFAAVWNRRIGPGGPRRRIPAEATLP